LINSGSRGNVIKEDSLFSLGFDVSGMAFLGLQVTGQYEMEKAGFSWIKVTFEDLQLQVHASPERVVVTRNRRSSGYNWKETLFLDLPG
jgi:hypothetical protein